MTLGSKDMSIENEQKYDKKRRGNKFEISSSTIFYLIILKPIHL